MKYCSIKDPPEFTELIEHWTRDTDADGEEMGRVIEQLLNNTCFLRKRNGRVLIGTADMTLDMNDTLFVVEADPDEKGEFDGAAYSNIVFSGTAPEAGQNWAQVDSSGSGRAGEEATESITGKNIITGKLAVAEDEPSNAAFFAKIIKE